MSKEIKSLLSQLKRLEWAVDENAQRRFNPLRSHLEWDDEMPVATKYSQSNPMPKVPDEAFELLNDLFIARNIICHLHDCGLSEKDIGLTNSEHYEKIWEALLLSDFNWAGLKRIQLSEDDKQELKNSIKKRLEEQV